MEHAAITAPLVAGRAVFRRRRAVAVLAAAAIVGSVLGAVVSGIFGGGGSQPSGSPKQAIAVVEAYSTALGNHDWATICNKLYSAAARNGAGASGCPQALAGAASDVRQPRLKILSVHVSGPQATVAVQAAVNGGPPLTNSIQLVRESGQYKIAAAGAD